MRETGRGAAFLGRSGVEENNACEKRAGERRSWDDQGITTLDARNGPGSGVPLPGTIVSPPLRQIIQMMASELVAHELTMIQKESIRPPR